MTRIAPLLIACGLLAGCTICLFDGNPGTPDLNALWRFVAEQRVDFFGAGAAFYASCQKAGIEPTQAGDLSRLRGLGSTGSPLSPENYQWLLDHVRQIAGEIIKTLRHRDVGLLGGYSHYRAPA